VIPFHLSSTNNSVFFGKDFKDKKKLSVTAFADVGA